MSLDLTRGAIGPWLYRLTAPMVMGILAIFLFNLVDTYFISLLGTQPLAAVSFTFPVTMLVMNMAIGLSIASGAVVARSFGQKNQQDSQMWVTSSLQLSLLLGIAIAMAGYLLQDHIFILLGAQQELLPLIRAYMSWWFLGSIGLICLIVVNACIRASGDTKFPSLVMLGAAVINGVLDPLLIFGLGPFPELGITGAAIATLISWLVACGVILRRVQKHQLIQWNLHHPLLPAWKKLLSLGIPASLTNMLGPLANGLLVAWVASYGTQAVAAYGVGSRLEPLALIVVMAFTASLPPFVGQNHGAGQYQRIELALKKSMQFLFVWQLTIYALMALLATPISQLFSDDLQVQHIIQLFIYILPISYIGVAMILVSTATINALHKTKISLRLNILRHFILYVPLAYMGHSWFGLSGLFVGCALANVLIGIYIVIMFQRIRHNPQARAKLLSV